MDSSSSYYHTSSNIHKIWRQIYFRNIFPLVSAVSFPTISAMHLECNDSNKFLRLNIAETKSSGQKLAIFFEHYKSILSCKTTNLFSNNSKKIIDWLIFFKFMWKIKLGNSRKKKLPATDTKFHHPHFLFNLINSDYNNRWPWTYWAVRWRFFGFYNDNMRHFPFLFSIWYYSHSHRFLLK